MAAGVNFPARRYYEDPRERAFGYTSATVAALCVALICVLLIPVYIYIGSRAVLRLGVTVVLP